MKLKNPNTASIYKTAPFAYKSWNWKMTQKSAGNCLYI